jgi:hypothetical protein
MNLTRLSHWEESLSIYIANSREARFAWGSNDCALFAAGAVRAITGEDLAAEFAGQYSTVWEAGRWLKAHGYRTFKDAVIAKMGTPVHPAKAGRGDIVIKGNALGVCVGKHCWFLGDEIIAYDAEEHPITQPALISWPTLLCDAAWKVAAC